MSRRRLTYLPPLPPLEPFPDEEEIFQPFDQHRPVPSIAKDSVRLKNKAKIEENLEEENDPARVSRLFYLQLYSSVLNAAAAEDKEKKEKLSTNQRKNLAQKFFHSVTGTLLKRKNSRDLNPDPDESLKRVQISAEQDFEQNASESLHESVVFETREPSFVTTINEDKMEPVSHFARHINSRSSQHRGGLSTPNPPIPVLNTRMKNLSQFSFKTRLAESQSSAKNNNEDLTTLRRLHR